VRCNVDEIPWKVQFKMEHIEVGQQRYLVQYVKTVKNVPALMRCSRPVPRAKNSR